MMAEHKCATDGCEDPVTVIDHEYEEYWCQEHWDAFSPEEQGVNWDFIS